MAHQTAEDFPPSLACLKSIGTLLRCPICFDFLNITMMTKCSHNFCSLCIRKFLSYKLLCPLCNTPLTEQDLRNNRLLDDLVLNFQTARQELSKANFESPPIYPKTPASVAKCKTPREKGQSPSNSILTNFFQKKPQTPSRKESQEQNVQRGKRQGAQTLRTNETDLHLRSSQSRVVVKKELMDEDMSAKCVTPVKQEEVASHSQSLRPETAHSSMQTQDVKPIIKVECPVCSVSVAQNFINKHLDICLSSEGKKDSLRSFSSRIKTRRPMAKLVYNLLSIQELKRRLKENHLSVQGSRDQLIKRHRDFVLLYNSQCDSLNPKSAEEIAKEVEASEKKINQLHGKTKPVLVFSKNQSEEEIDEMNSNYRKQHSSDFSRLIAQVRGRLGNPRQPRAKQEVVVKKEDVQESNSSVAETKSSPGGDQSPRSVDLSSSPALSDVSISSSISDIFGPESSIKIKAPETSPAQKRPPSTRGSDAVSSPVVGKRRRKT
uniref:RING-type E3 ubiquitin transferase n=2 Tax=Nothobranchius kadleci TaxID=1051664 RepID=A0A1A8CYL5_NOTKA